MKASADIWIAALRMSRRCVCQGIPGKGSILMGWLLRCFAAPFCHSFQESWSCHRSAWKASWKPFRISRRRRRRRKHSNNYRRMPAQHSFNQRFGWIWQVSLQYVNMQSQSMWEVDPDTMILMILVDCSKCNFDVLWAAWASSWSHPRWITSLGKDVMASKVWAFHLVTRDLWGFCFIDTILMHHMKEHSDAWKMHLIQQMFFYISHYHRLFLTFSGCFGMLGFIKRIFGGIPRLPNHLSTSTM